MKIITQFDSKRRFAFRIANLNLLVEADIVIKGLTYQRYDPFRIENVAPDVIFSYRMVPKFDETIRTKDQYIERNPVCRTVIDFKRNRLHTSYLSKFKGELEQFRLGPYLLAPFLSSFSAAMIHCSAVIRNGKIAVFLAPDEGGKTTSAKLAPQKNILCDDQNIIRKENNEYHVYATPWGMIANNFGGPIGAFFMIEKADRFALTPIHPDTLLSYLWNEHLPYLFCLPKKYSQRHFNFLFELSRRTPVYRMRFPPKKINWDSVDRAMA